MNPYLERLQSYPFERLSALNEGITPSREYPPVALSIGEPKHAPPGFVLDVLIERTRLETDLSAYPATRGTLELREAIAGWLQRRFTVQVNPEMQILPVAGTREALFSFGQAVLSGRPESLVILPNPFYQIYEGATLLGGDLDCASSLRPQRGHYRYDSNQPRWRHYSRNTTGEYSHEIPSSLVSCQSG